MSEEWVSFGSVGQEKRESERRSKESPMSEAVKEGFSVLLAIKDALQEAHHRGDLSTGRAREVLKETLDKGRAAAEEARDGLSFINQADLDEVMGTLDALNTRVSELEKKVLSGLEDPPFGH